VVATNQLRLGSGSRIATVTDSSADAGNIQIQASGAVELGDRSFIVSSSGETATGNGGEIGVAVGQLRLGSGSLIFTSTAGLANAGNIEIQASDAVDLGDSSIIRSFRGGMATGTVGNIQIDSQSNITLMGGATIRADNGGDILIAANRLRLSGSSSILAETNSSANAGNIEIEAGDFVELSDRSQITSSSAETATGNGGDVTIQARNGVTLTRSQIFAALLPSNTVKKAGNITLETGQLQLQAGSIISATTFGSGAGGDIVIQADDISVSGVDIFENDGDRVFLPSSIITSVDRDASGEGGDLTIDTRRLTLSNGGSIIISTLGNGNTCYLTR